MERIDTNKVKTVYGRPQIYNYLNKYIKDGSLKYIKINKRANNNGGVQFPAGANSPSISNSIPSNNSTVNNQYMQDSQNNTQYSIAGQKGMQNAINQDTRFIKLENNFNRAQTMAQQGVDNEYIRRNTNWFQDKNGDWKFEFSDKDMALKKGINLVENNTYRLGDILEHDILFTIYPELANYNVKIENIKNAKGSYNRKNNLIRINSKLKNSENIQSTLIHEIQHAIQKIEGFERGQNFKTSKLAYYNSLGEIEADDTKNRYIAEKSGTLNRDLIPPESSKASPSHSKVDNYLNNRTTFDKIKDGIYRYLRDRGVINDSIFEELDLENTNENTGLVVRGRRVKGLEKSSSFSFQNNDKWQIYLDKNWDLMPNSTKTFGFPTNEQLNEMDRKSIEEDIERFNLKEKKTTKLEDIANMTEDDVKQKEKKYRQKKDENTNNIEKLADSIYNQTGGAENGQRNRNQKTVLESKTWINETTRRQRENSEILENKIRSKLIATPKSDFINQYQNRYNTVVSYFDDDRIPSFTSTNGIFISKKQADIYGIETILKHETVENMLLNHTNEVIDDFSTLINEIRNNENAINKLFSYYKSTLSAIEMQKIVKDLHLFSKEILCDFNTTELTDLESQNLRKIYIDTFGEDFYNKALSIIQEKDNQIYQRNSNKGSFSMPKESLGTKENFVFPTAEELQEFDRQQAKKAYESLNGIVTNDIQNTSNNQIQQTANEVIPQQSQIQNKADLTINSTIDNNIDKNHVQKNQLQ